MDYASSHRMHATGPQAWLLPRAVVDKATTMSLVAATLPKQAGRLHLQHGPIDLIIEALGCSKEVLLAYRQAELAFSTILSVLAAQLPRLRDVLSGAENWGDFQGDVAQRMFIAARPYCPHDVTPMIAVAGAVADHVLEAMLVSRCLQRVQVNNGGDIALYLAPGAHCRVGICSSPSSSTCYTTRQVAPYQNIITLAYGCGVGGIATSGWKGRSHSLGIADAVTVLAANAASADVAATLIANAVDLPHSEKIQRVPASALTPDSDLVDRPVTVSVERLTKQEADQALAAGARFAKGLIKVGLITGAYISVQSHCRIVGAELANFSCSEGL